MFNSKKAQPPIRTLIGEGSVLQGEIRFSDGLRIDGEVQGDVVADDATSTARCKATWWPTTPSRASS